MYHKDFDSRTIIKKETNDLTLPDTLFIKQRQIWFIRLGCNIGFEQDGKWEEFARPVLVMKKLGNTFFVVPLTTWGKDSHIFYHTISSIDFEKPSKLILNQAKTISKERFMSHIATISQDEFQQVKNLIHTYIIHMRFLVDFAHKGRSRRTVVKLV